MNHLIGIDRNRFAVPALLRCGRKTTTAKEKFRALNRM